MLDENFIAQAEVRALAATEKRMARDMVELERSNEELRCEARRLSKLCEVARENEGHREREANAARSDARQSAADAERAEAECRRYRAELLQERADYAKRAAEFERLRAVSSRELEEQRKETDRVVEELALLKQELSLMKEEQAGEIFERKDEARALEIAENRIDVLEIEVVRARDGEAEAKKALAAAKKQIRRNAEEASLFSLRRRAKATTNTKEEFVEETVIDELRRIARESQHRAEMAHRRNEQLSLQLKREKTRTIAAESAIDNLKISLDRALKAAKHERHRCAKLKAATLVIEEEVDESPPLTFRLPRSNLPIRQRPAGESPVPAPIVYHDGVDDDIPPAFRDDSSSSSDDDSTPLV